MSRKRPLTPEEETLWRSITKDIEPLEESLPDPVRDDSEPHHVSKAELKRSTSTRAWSGTMKPSPPSSGSTIKVTPTQQPLSSLDRKTAQKVRRGRIEVDATVDLHGKTQDKAHRRLTNFVSTAWDRGYKVILVITGKGYTAEDTSAIWARDRAEDPFTGRGGGVLRTQVPLWLEEPPLRHMVHSIQTAHQTHGGSGAYYVFLRRRRI